MQQTAYEMRISDWSSDVCSSDLPWRDAPGGEVGFGARAARFAAHRPAQSVGKGEAQRVGQAAVTIALQHHALAARHHRHFGERADDERSEEHTSELQSLMRISYAVFCLQKKKPVSIRIQ